MRTRFVTGLGAAALAMIAVACTLSTAPLPDQNVSEFCDDWAKAICQLSSASCDFVASACETHQNMVCRSFVTAAESGTRQYNQPNGRACIEALNSAYGNSPVRIDASTLLAVNATCAKVAIGNQAVNQRCTDDNDCSGSLVCVPAVGQSGPVCASSVTKKDAGDVCADPGDQCQGDSYCAVQSSGQPQCVATPATNQPCSASIPCSSADHCQNGVCQLRGASGAPCVSSDDCGSSAPYCDTYPPAACTNGLTFARGSFDCNGIAGLDVSDGGTASGD